MTRHPAVSTLLAASAALGLLALAGCGHSPNPAPAAPPPAPVPSAAQIAAEQRDAATAEAARAEELAAKEKELADREAALKQKELEQELGRRNAENAAVKAKAAAAAPKKAPAPAKVAAAAPVKPPAPPPPLVVPAGTQLAIALDANLDTKTAKVGDPVQGHLSSDVVVNGRRAVAAGATAYGSVTQVISGSRKIGGTPTLGIAFDRLVLASGATVPIAGQLVQQGKSDTGKDTAKILGGAAAGAIIGHQINSKNGSIVGGILGGAAGTVAAEKTGGEVTLPAGTAVSATTEAPFQVNGG